MSNYAALILIGLRQTLDRHERCIQLKSTSISSRSRDLDNTIQNERGLSEKSLQILAQCGGSDAERVWVAHLRVAHRVRIITHSILKDTKPSYHL